MLFNSMAYAVFLPVVFILYWMLPHKCRWLLLLIASYYFYMSWNPKYVVLILFTTVISYFSGILLERECSTAGKKWIVAGACVLCLGVLFFFKYFNFFTTSVTRFLGLFAIHLDPLTVSFLLPVGISFYTFQTLSYVVDVYKGDIEAEHHFGYYATFISFFPQLVAGPIERTRNLLPQIKCRHRFDYEKATYGLKLMAWGYFKKLVIADVVATYTGKIFDNPISFNGENGFSFCIAAVFFSFQIYCDFSGYSDIAVGTAKLLGIDLMTNFKSPYFSQSIREFWNRWHISLSTWFRDYVYIPLGGNRVGKARHAFNLLVTFLVSGLWHGASWSFVVWGGIHGLGQALENRFLRGRAKSNRPLWAVFRMILVFVFCTVAWVFFASNSVHGAVYILAHMLRGISSPLAYVRHGFAYLGLGKGMVCKITLSICILLLYDFLALKGIDVIERIGQMHWSIRWGVYLLFLLLIFFWAEIGNNTFIYFQF